MDKCSKCGQDLEINDKFCRNCGQPREIDEDKVSEETVVPSSRKKDDDIDTLDISLIEKARKEEIRRELEAFKNRKEIEENEKLEEESRDYKDYELEKTQVIGDINQYITEDERENINQNHKNNRSHNYDDDYDGGYVGGSNHNKKKIDKKIIYGLAGVAAVIIAVILIFALGGKEELTKEQLVENYVKALNNRNESEIVGLLQSPTPDLKIDKQGISAYFKYIDENPSYIEKVKFELEEQSKYYDKNKGKDIGERFENVVMRYEDGKYYLEIKPYYLNVKVKSADVELYLNDKKIDTTTSDNYEKEFGPFMPGIYDLRGNILSQSEEDSAVEKVVLYDDKPDVGKLVKTVELDLKLVSFKLSSNNQDAFIIVNGKKTNTRVKDLPNGVFGPVSKSTKIQLSLETPFGELKSKEISVSEISSEVKLDIDFTSDVIVDGLTKSINNFTKEDAKAMEILSTSVYTNIGEPELSKKDAVIQDMVDLNQSIETVLYKNVYDLSSLQIKEQDGKYYASVVVKTELEQTILADFAVEKSDDPKYGEYTAEYDANKKTWIITNVENTSNFNLANTKEYKF